MDSLTLKTPENMYHTPGYEKDINCEYVGRHLAASLEFRQ